jgi:aminopeptidase-like protein
MPTAIDRLLADFDDAALGPALHDFAAGLYPICRSITGDGVRRTLAAVAARLPALEVHEVPSGTAVCDWTVPPEWNVRGAWIKDPQGHTVVDFADHNLHLVSYSAPFRGRLPLAALKEHLHSLPEQPGLIPYRTSYYREDWGFCLPHSALAGLPDGEYEVAVDTTLEPGSLTYGECLLPGETEREVLVSCHVCHPSLANDNLSGLAVSTFLAEALGRLPRRRHGFRFLFIPGTIGAITWLSRNEEAAARIDHGLVAANLGDPGPFHYKRSRRGDAVIDRAVVRALADLGEPLAVEDFVPFGYDERQYCSPGFDLAVGSLTRTPWGRYPEYHTSADDLDLIRPASLAGSLRAYLAVANVLEADRTYLNLNPRCEPQLGRRGLYRALGGGGDHRERELALLWVLNLGDGAHSLLDVAERSGMSFAAVAAAAKALLAAGLPAEPTAPPAAAGEGGR